MALWLLETQLTTTAHGTHFAAGDGRMAEAVARVAYKFSLPFAVTNLDPTQGVGSQLLPINVWANPIYWPLAFLDGKLATDIAGLVALLCFAAACYVMARCFDLPPLWSAVAAQLAVVVRADRAVLDLTASFVLLPGLAVVSPPFMVALGLLRAAIPSGRGTVLLPPASGFFVLQPVVRPAVERDRRLQLGRAVAVVAVSSLRLKPILLHGAALTGPPSCCRAACWTISPR